MIYIYRYRNYLNLFKKKHISAPIFQTEKTSSVDRKMDELIDLLAEQEPDEEKLQELKNRFDNALRSSVVYREANNVELFNRIQPGEVEIILSHKKTKRLGHETGKKISVAFRMVISVLMITMGFAMIIMPAPPFFEMYTIYYFNAQDGFTLMDLISLIIVFCGIYTLITARKTANRDY